MTGKRILLAEDDSDDQQFFKDFLQDRQDLVLLPVVTDGVEVMEYLHSRLQAHQSLPDAIILDQNMPRQNGLQTLQQLKHDPRYAHITVMIYSTYTDEQLIKNCLAKGAAIVYPKPHDKEGYHHMIDTLFSLV